MLQGLLDPKIDFVFKQIFGSAKHPRILISFLNATLKPTFPITMVEIENTDLEKNYVRDKFSRLDVHATTSQGEVINVEIQLKNEHNMIKRSLYYWGKLYEEQLGEGDDYTELRRTVCINILNFKYLKNNRYHNGYRLKEVDTNEELTNILEIHFIEIPKLQDETDEKDMLVAWTEFLKNPESPKVRSLENNIHEIREAKDELIRLSADKEQRRIYAIRSKALKDETSALNKAKREGLEEGIQQGLQQGLQQGIDVERKNAAKKMKEAGISLDIIMSITHLSEEEIENIEI